MCKLYISYRERINCAKKGKELGFGQSRSADEKNRRSRPLIRLRAAIEEGNSDFAELYVALEARQNEEFFAAAWLRAECHWEGQENVRNAENFKWLFVEKEFVALKKRCCDAQFGKKCNCILMVKKEDEKAKETLLNRVVGTLDLHVRYFSPGQTFPEERVMPTPLGPKDRRASNSYGYISNLCVAKSARRRGLAAIMLHHAISTAKEHGLEKVFLHVYRDNEAALRLYEKMGFKVVDAANFDQFSSAQPLLMCFQAST